MDVTDIVEEVLFRLERSKKPVLCNVSNHHVHLTTYHIDKLFGTGYGLKKLRSLMQPGEYAARETVDILGPKVVLKKVRVLGPPREFTQIELSRTDCYKLGIDAPVRESGNITGTPRARLIGTCGSVEINQGVIVAQRHIHMTPQDAEAFKVKDRQRLRVRTNHPRSVVFEDVVVRVSDNYCLECHIDTDEANSSDLRSGAEVFLA